MNDFGNLGVRWRQNMSVTGPVLAPKLLPTLGASPRRSRPTERIVPLGPCWALPGPNKGHSLGSLLGHCLLSGARHARSEATTLVTAICAQHNLKTVHNNLNAAHNTN